MYIEVDVSAGPNCSWDLARMFSAMGEPRELSRVVAPDPQGNEARCHVTGWSVKGPCPAMAVLVEDSGDGLATLVYGGEQGIRLKAADDEGSWDLENSSQWGEPCLLLDRDVEIG